MVEVASGVGLNVRCDGVDVSEDVDLHDGGDDSRGLDGAGLDGRLVTVSPGFAKSSGKTSQTVSHSFSISAVI